MDSSRCILGVLHFFHNQMQNCVFPMENTVCVINADASYPTEPMRIAINVTKGYSEDMDKVVDSAAAKLAISKYDRTTKYIC